MEGGYSDNWKILNILAMSKRLLWQWRGGYSDNVKGLLWQLKNLKYFDYVDKATLTMEGGLLWQCEGATLTIEKS